MLKNGYRTDPKRTDDGASKSPARGRCPHGRLRWDRRNTTSREVGFPSIDTLYRAPDEREIIRSFGGNGLLWIEHDRERLAAHQFAIKDDFALRV
jgi:hypothetical protein